MQLFTTHPAPLVPPPAQRISDADVLCEEARLLHGIETAADAPGDERLRQLRQGLHDLPDADAPCALCLSGGGIRSATFGLGVLQGLARQGYLGRFHYLSTVSGGGYIGSWLSAWMQRRQMDEQMRCAAQNLPPPPPVFGQQQVIAELAAGARGPVHEPEPLRQLRAYSNFLSPMRGISADALTLLAIYLRNLVLNWLVLLPVLAAVLMLPRLQLAMLSLDKMPVDGLPIGIAGLAVALVVWVIAFMAYDLPAPPRHDAPQAPETRSGPPILRTALGLTAPLVLAAVLLSWLLGWWAEDAAFMAKPLAALGRVAVSLGVADLPPWAWAAVAGAGLHLSGGMIGAMLRWWLRGSGAGRGGHWLGTLVAVLLSGAVGGVAVERAGSLYIAQNAAQEAQQEARLAHVRLAHRDAPPVKTAQAQASLNHAEFETTRLRDARRTQLAVLGAPVLLLCFWLGVSSYAGMHRHDGGEDEREWWARASALWLEAAVAWALLAGLVLWLPGWLLGLAWLQTPNAPEAAGLGAAALGLLSTAVGYLSTQAPAWRRRATTVASTLGMRVVDLAAVLFLVGALLLLSYGIGCSLRLASEPMRDTSRASDQWVQQRAYQQALAVATASARQRGAAAQAPACADQCAAPAALMAGRYQRALHAAPLSLTVFSLLALLFFAFAVSKCIGVNAFSMHSLYGNRLVRAYLGASRLKNARHPHWFTGFDPADNLTMASLAPDLQPRLVPADDGTATWLKPATPRHPPAPRLFPVVNAALNLVAPSGNRQEWQDRKATSFTISPLSCGSPLTGHVAAADYGGMACWRGVDAQGRLVQQAEPGPALKHPQPSGGISLGHAMTISGAAASPNMGYHSSIPLALVMTLFNVRLGAWLPNPGFRGLFTGKLPALWRRSEPSLGLVPLLDEALGNTHERNRFLNLSDGGHFENLGLYEMVRRRCRRIVLVDATCDPHYRHADLTGALRKIRIDMGIPIEFEHGLPGPVALGGNGAHVAIGRVRYDAVDSPREGQPLAEGLLVLIKPMLSGDEPLDVMAYAASALKQDAGFPQQGTGDQFYDETQFESYRMLGLHSVLHGLPGQGHWPDAKPGVQALASGSRAAGAAARQAKAMRVAGAGGAAAPVTASGSRATGTAAGSSEAAADTSGAADEKSASGLRISSGGLAGMVSGHSGAIAATALASTVAITGAVQLANPVVRLEDPVVRLENPVVRLDSTGLTLNAPAAGASNSGTGQAADPGAWAASAASAARSLSELGGAADRARSQVATLADSASSASVQAELLSRRLKALEVQKPAPGASAPTTAVVELTKDQHNALMAIARSASAAASGIQMLQGAIDATAPRRNVRGSSEGQTR